jgi:L-threonylcarbamoyladenylate synthase
VAPRRIRLAGGAGDAEAAQAAAAVLDAGGVAILPAEGVYGYHVRVDRPAGLARLASIKPREPGRGFILLVADAGELPRWAAAPLDRAADLAREHWPGALTLVLPAADAAPPDVRGSDGTVALRCPGSAFLRSLLRLAGTALVSTSANAPGAPAPARPPERVPDGVDLVVDGGALSGAPSTVVRVTGSELLVLRSGAVRIDAGAS